MGPHTGAVGTVSAADDPKTLVEAWLRRAVVGHGLCPYAKAPLDQGRVRVEAVRAKDPLALVARIDEAARWLVVRGAQVVETTLLACDEPWLDFEALLDVLGLADRHLHEVGLDGAVQLVGFHPAYRFEGAPAEDPANATNRAPVPVVQLLRRASVAAAAAEGDPEAVWRRNVAYLRRLGSARARALYDRAALTREPEAAGRDPGPGPGDPAAS